MEELLKLINEEGIIRARDYQRAKDELRINDMEQRERVQRARESLRNAQSAYERAHACHDLRYELRKLGEIVE